MLLALSTGQPTESSERGDRERGGQIDRAEQRAERVARDRSRPEAEPRRQTVAASDSGEASGEIAAPLSRPAGANRKSRHPKLSPSLSDRAQRDARPRAMVDVIVRFDRKPGAAERALAKQLGGEDRRGYRRLPFRVMRIPARKLEALADQPSVKFVSTDGAIASASPPARQTAKVPGSTYQLNNQNKYYRGSGIVVAVVDSGVYEHGDYYNTLLGQFDFVNGAGGVQTALTDPFGHGTHIAGMMGADGYHSSAYKYQGVATQAGIISLRVLDDQGRGSVSNLIAAMDWILDVGIPTYGIRVANLSLGKGVDEPQALDPLVQAVDAVWDAGVAVVVSAGNYGQSGHYTITSPGNSRKVITVGSLTDHGSGKNFADDSVSTYSSRGPTLYDHVLKPDLLAPGNKVVSTFAEYSTIESLLPPGRVLCGMNGTCNERYLQLSGTSMAAAVVSGGVARMLDKDASLNPATIKARLMKTARKMGGDPTLTGAGVLDVDSAMNATGVVTGQALSPLINLSADGTRVYIENTATLWGGSQWAASTLWSNASLWSNGYLLADGYLWADAYLWANGYMWSNAYLWPNGALWSTSTLWSNAYLWANGILWSNFAEPFSTDGEDPSGPEDPAEDVVVEER
jgi:serine protease AprX